MNRRNFIVRTTLAAVAPAIPLPEPPPVYDTDTLLKFCAGTHYTRPALTHPFVVNRRIYATCGRMIVRVPDDGRNVHVPKEGKPPYPEDLEWSQPEFPPVRLAIPEGVQFTEPCPFCDVIDALDPCEDCNGTKIIDRDPIPGSVGDILPPTLGMCGYRVRKAQTLLKDVTWHFRRTALGEKDRHVPVRFTAPGIGGLLMPVRIRVAADKRLAFTPAEFQFVVTPA